MLKRFLAFSLIAGVGFALLAGCDDTPEQNRSVVTVASINCGVPGWSDMLTDSMGRADTWTVAIMQNRPYSGLITTVPGGPYGDFLVTGYVINWTALNGGPVLPSRMEPTGFSIPSGEFFGASIRLVSIPEKQSLAAALPGLDGSEAIMMQAEIIFMGHETGTERDVEVKTGLTVSFTNFYPDPDQPDCTF